VTQQLGAAEPHPFTKTALWQVMVFACIGVLATATHFILALAANTQVGAPPMVANVIGYLGSVLISYVGNARLTFQRGVFDRAQFLRFAAVSLAGLLLGQGITYVATHLLKLPFQLALIPVVTVVPAFTFIASRLWAFAAVRDADGTARAQLPEATRAALAAAARPALFTAIFLLAAVPVVAAPVLPLIDYYGHVARFFVLAHIDRDPFLAASYAPHWQILPNIGLDVIGTALIGGQPTLTVAKALVLLIFAMQYFGVLAFNRQVAGRASLLVAVMAATLLYSFVLGWGFANFLLGLGLLFWGAAWWLAQRHRPWIAIPVACVLAVAIFLTHGVAFVLYGLLLGGLELGMFLASTPRSFAKLAKAGAALAVQAIAPVLLFMASPTSASSDGLTNADEAIRRLSTKGELSHRISELLYHRLATIVRVAESPSLLLDAAGFVLVIAVLALLVIRRRITLPPYTLPAIGIGVLLVIFTPPALLGVGFIADRMPLFLALLVTGSIVVRNPLPRFDLACVAALVVLAAVKLTWIGVSWQGYRQDFAQYQRVASAIPGRSLVGYVNGANLSRNEVAPRCHMYGPLLIPLHGQATDIFAFSTQQPIALAGRLDAAVKSAARANTPDGRLADAETMFLTMQEDGLFDYVLTCGDATGIARRSHLAPIAHEGRFTLFRLDRKTAPSGGPS
jgi:putative flippase GtrA